MKKQEQELRQALEDARNEAKTLNDEGKAEEAKAKLKEAKAAKAKLDDYLQMQADFEGTQPPEPQNKGGQMNPVPQEPQNKQEEYKSAFFKAISGKQLDETEMSVVKEFNAAMTEGTDADGGFTVPEDIQTRIQKLKNTVDNLEQYVTVEGVSTDAGQRTLEVRADSTPFVNVAEMGALGDMGNPQFQRLSYAIQKYAGFMQVSNELLSDTAENLQNYISNWIAKKSKATRNDLILTQLNTLTKTAFADYSDIKATLNVTLDPAISQNATIFTNQDGYNYLDQQEDADGRPLLQPDPTAPTRKLLFGKTVVVLSNKTLATPDDGAGNDLFPFIVGDMKEAVVLFDRKKMSIEMTKEGGNAWRNDSTEMRAIEREDVKLRDSESLVYGQISVPQA